MRNSNCDAILCLAAAVLILIGIVMLFSASAVFALEEYKDPYYFLKRQLLWLALGSIVLYLARNMDYRTLDKLAYPALFVAFALLVAVMLPNLGKEVGGARRWLSLGKVNFQPSELAKFAVVLFMAKSLVKRADKLKNFMYGYFPNLIVLGVFFILILFQPDFGTAVIICAVTFMMFFVAGIRFKFLVYSVLAALPFMVLAVMGAEYRTRRILSFLDPWQDPSDTGFQAVQSFYAFGRGGYWGLGLGDGRQKLFYLPEAHTDFIFSVIGEELGFMGTTGILVLFAIFVWRGFVTAYRARDSFGSHLAVGLTLLIGFQAFINMGVAVGLLPTKGLPLPFISMGGSSLLVSMLCVGVLLNISEHTVRH
ncbi:MAG: putative lipid II flippase FtsW [Nitrospinae bacterium]|nr:putative lipid II flippase FtsW [Nitrospinota bacterium]